MLKRTLFLKNKSLKFGKYALNSKVNYNLYPNTIKPTTLSKSYFSTEIKKNYSTNTGISGKYDALEDLDDSTFSIIDSSNTERLADFENKVNQISSSLLLNINDSKKFSQDDLNKYWKDLIVEYENSCNFYDSQCDFMDLIVLRQYLNLGLRTNIFELKYSDMLSKFIHLVTIVKAGTNRDFAIELNDLKLRHNKEVLQTINEKVELRLIAIFKEFLKFLEFVPLKRSSHDISINFFLIIFLRLLNENGKTLSRSDKSSNIKLKLLNFLRSEMSKKKNILQPAPSTNNSFLRELQVNNFNSLSIDENVNIWDMDSIRALQKSMIYRVIRTQDPEVISNFWDNFNFRSVFYKNNIIESWYVFIEQMELIFKKENVTMQPYMKNYIKNELLLTLEHDLISISEIKIKKGQNLVDKLNQFI